MHNIKEEIIKELHKLDKMVVGANGLTSNQLDLAYRLACTYHYLDKISHKKEDSAQHYLERSEHYYKRGEYDLSKSYLSKAKGMWMSESDKDWYADLESKLSKKREEQ